MKAKEKQLLEYLKKHCLGQENAVSGKRLKKILRVHEAELRKLVHNLRWMGRPSAATAPATSTPQTAGGVYHNPSAPTDGARTADGLLGHDPGYGRLPPAWGR